MDIGISTACLHNTHETEDALTALKNIGAQTCEVYLRTFYEYRPEFAKKYADRVDGVKVNSVHVAPLNFEPQLFIPQRRTRGDGFYWLDQVMRSAQLLGAKNYTFNGIVRGGGADKFDYYAECLNRVAEFCSRYGVKLCLENAQYSLFNRPEVFAELKNRCPDISGVFDIKQARKSGYPYAMYVSAMQGRISHVHISDVDENGKTCLPGAGIYDFEEIFKRLKGAGFDGSVLIETENFGEISELEKSLDFLREKADKIN